MKKITTTLLLCLIALAAHIDAAVLHVIIAGDTQCNIGSGVEVDIALLRTECERIAKFTGLELRETTFIGEDFDSELILTSLKTLEAEPDDVVMYYHTSHGFRTRSMEKHWPALDFGAKPALDLSDIIAVLGVKQQRLTLILADCCNNCIPDWAVPPFCRMQIPYFFRRGYESRNYRHLFLEQQGMVVATASKPGQYAWIDLYFGGFFTTSFLYNLKAVCQRAPSESVSWDDVLLNCATDTLNRSQSTDHSQEPVYMVDTRCI